MIIRTATFLFGALQRRAALPTSFDVRARGPLQSQFFGIFREYLGERQERAKNFLDVYVVFGRAFQHFHPQFRQLAIHPFGDVLDAHLAMRRRQIELITRHDHRDVLEIGALLPDLLEALLDAREGRIGRDGVDEEERVRGRDAQSAHRRKLHLARRVQNVHFQGHVTQVVLAIVEILDGAAVLVGVGVVEETAHDAALADARAAQHDDSGAFVVGHVFFLANFLGCVIYRSCRFTFFFVDYRPIFGRAISERFLRL